MNNDKPVLKDDINFLEYPNWIVSKRNSLKTYAVEKNNGKYIISTTENIDRLPDRIDKIILYYLMSYLMKNNFMDRVVEISRYKIAREALGSFRYDRIMLGLKRWHKISIDFDGIFYDGDGYSTRYFNVIDDVILKDNSLKIFFNIQFMEQIKNSQYFKLVNFNEYKRLKRPVSARLYEIIVKNFKDRKDWQIGIIKLAEKLTLEKRKNNNNYYPSDVLIKVRPAVNEISKKTELKINFEYNKKTQVCAFMKVAQKSKSKKETKTLPLEKLHKDSDFKKLITLLPQKHHGKKTILNVITSAYHKHGYDYVARNIKYTNQCSNGNYRAYLSKALKEDWGVSIQEDEEAEKGIIKEKECKAIEKANCQQQEKELTKQVKEYIGNLSPDEVEDLKIQALKRLESSMQEKVKAGNYYAKTALKIEMETLVSESLK